MNEITFLKRKHTIGRHKAKMCKRQTTFQCKPVGMRRSRAILKGGFLIRLNTNNFLEGKLFWLRLKQVYDLSSAVTRLRSSQVWDNSKDFGSWPIGYGKLSESLHKGVVWSDLYWKRPWYLLSSNNTQRMGNLLETEIHIVNNVESYEYCIKKTLRSDHVQDTF